VKRFLPISIPITAIPELSLCGMACSSSLASRASFLAGGAGARPDHPISGHCNPIQVNASPGPRRSDRRGIGLEDAADNIAASQHVVVIFVPLAGWSAGKSQFSVIKRERRNASRAGHAIDGAGERCSQLLPFSKQRHRSPLVKLENRDVRLTGRTCWERRVRAAERRGIRLQRLFQELCPSRRF
jgi:hypothetical protein